MSDFTIIGRAVTHTARPRFRVVFQPTAAGGWEVPPGEIEWLDGPPPMPSDPKQAKAAADYFARLMRECGDYFAKHCREDWLQERVIARAKELNLTAYAIAKATGWAVSEDHVRDFLTRSKSMGSHKLQHVLAVLGLTLTPRG